MHTEVAAGLRHVLRHGTLLRHAHLQHLFYCTADMRTAEIK